MRGQGSPNQCVGIVEKRLTENPSQVTRIIHGDPGEGPTAILTERQDNFTIRTPAEGAANVHLHERRVKFGGTSWQTVPKDLCVKNRQRIRRIREGGVCPAAVLTEIEPDGRGQITRFSATEDRQTVDYGPPCEKKRPSHPRELGAQ